MLFLYTNIMKKTVNLTKQGKEALEAELEELKSRRPAIADRLATARSFGDLSENQEYTDARNEQKTVENRIIEIEDILKSAKVIRAQKKDKIALGSTVKIRLNRKQFTYTLVSPVEADPLNSMISNESPIGKALLGLKVDDQFELPNGNKGTVLEIG